MTQPPYTNRLIGEKSPYLLQHAHNPVDWYPWGEEAFSKAKEEDKPIFLSIGYATCHWCHVMEKESFNNPTVANLLNETFVNIKVDREELPEVDSLYIEFAQSMMAGAAGWPLNLVLTPDLEPIFASTYLPPEPKGGMMGLSDLIDKIKEIWEGEEREAVKDQAAKIVEMFEASVHTTGENLPDGDLIDQTADILYKMADPIFGGMQGIPKFPIGYQYSFLDRYYAFSQDSRALFLVEKTLDHICQGGIYDHLAGGISRYSTDQKWLVPHFEKMLYDNAIFLKSLVETWQLTKKPLYAEVCKQIINYLIEEMSSEEGGFYSAEDADSEGVEGLYYTWEYDEVMDIVKNRPEFFCQYFGIIPEGNFEGRNILHVEKPLEEFAEQKQVSLKEAKQIIDQGRINLLEQRKKRKPPLKDDKILSGWNGLVIDALAECACAFESTSYLNVAVKAAQCIKNHLWKEDKLLRRYRDGESNFSASLEDYAFMIKGCLTLFEVGAGTEWLKWAIEMTNRLKTDFKAELGAFYQTDGTDNHLILRKCQFSDGAEPSGNAVHAENLLRLYQMTNNEEYLDDIEDILKASKELMEMYPPGYCYGIMNVQRYYDPDAPTIVVALNSKREFEEEIKKAIFTTFIPHRALIWQTSDIELEELIPYINEYESVNDQTTLYVCLEGVCEAPVNGKEAILEKIESLI